jgi:hypothetical protein
MQTFKCNTELIEGHLKLLFSGFLTLHNAREIKNFLSNLTGEFQTINIQVREVSGVDVSFLQIIEAFRSSQVNAGRKVKISMDMSYDLKSLFSNAGISYPVK